MCFREPPSIFELDPAANVAAWRGRYERLPEARERQKCWRLRELRRECEALLALPRFSIEEENRRLHAGFLGSLKPAHRARAVGYLAGC
jgi:hypothetical protein